MSRLVRATAIGSILVLALAASAQAAIVSNTKDFHQQDTGWVECANGGAGELVTIDGYIHEVITYTEPPSGRATLTVHYAPAGLTGIGQTTGDVYQAPGRVESTSNWVVSDPGTTYVAQTTLRFPLIGPGRSNNSYFAVTEHLTVTPAGDVVVEFSDLRVACR